MKKCVIKVDIMKVYDSLEWKFIISLLNCMNFLAYFVHWLESCIKTPSFLICINGELERVSLGALGA